MKELKNVSCRSIEIFISKRIFVDDVNGNRIGFIGRYSKTNEKLRSS